MKWLDEPITWRKSLKLSGISIALIAIWYVVACREYIAEYFKAVKEVVFSKKEES